MEVWWIGEEWLRLRQRKSDRFHLLESVNNMLHTHAFSAARAGETGRSNGNCTRVCRVIVSPVYVPKTRESTEGLCNSQSVHAHQVQ